MEQSVLARRQGRGEVVTETGAQKRHRIANCIQWLQNTRDYADEVEAAKLTAEIARLLDIIDPLEEPCTLNAQP